MIESSETTVLYTQISKIEYEYEIYYYYYYYSIILSQLKIIVEKVTLSKK